MRGAECARGMPVFLHLPFFFFLPLLPVNPSLLCKKGGNSFLRLGCLSIVYQGCVLLLCFDLNKLCQVLHSHTDASFLPADHSIAPQVCAKRLDRETSER